MRTVLMVLCFSCLSVTVHAARPEAPKKKVTPILAVPLSGGKTVLRFMVRNDGDKPVIVDGPFANQTRLVVEYPDGRRKEASSWKEMDRVPDPLQPGKSVQWDIDVAKWIELKESGTYRISFSVSGAKSNQIILVKD